MVTQSVRFIVRVKKYRSNSGPQDLRTNDIVQGEYGVGLGCMLASILLTYHLSIGGTLTNHKNRGPMYPVGMVRYIWQSHTVKWSSSVLA